MVAGRGNHPRIAAILRHHPFRVIRGEAAIHTIRVMKTPSSRRFDWLATDVRPESRERSERTCAGRTGDRFDRKSDPGGHRRPVERAAAGRARAARLILVAAVANLNLAVANVALPDIGEAFDASQTALNLIAVGYSLGLAASVLYLGARRRPLRAQADARPRHGAVDPGVPARRLGRRRSRCCSPPACSAGSPPAWRSRRRWR